MKTLIIALSTIISLSASATDFDAYIKCTSFGTTATLLVSEGLDQRLVVTNTFFDKTQTIVDEAVVLEGSVIKDTETNGKSVTLKISEQMTGSLQINKPEQQFQSQGMNCEYL